MWSDVDVDADADNDEATVPGLLYNKHIGISTGKHSFNMQIHKVGQYQDQVAMLLDKQPQQQQQQ